MLNYWFYSMMNARVGPISINTTTTATDLNLPSASKSHTVPVYFLK